MLRAWCVMSTVGLWCLTAACDESVVKRYELRDGAAESCGAEGVSVACTGPGGCEGGQACRSDGTFGACDCDAVPATKCGATGVVVACVGNAGCLGVQACQDNGKYTECVCPPVTPAETITLTVDEPKADAVLKGTVLVGGGASANVVALGVSVAGSAYMAASGSPTSWALSLDTTSLPNGKTSLVVSARTATGREITHVVPVTIANFDPIIGMWQSTLDSRCSLYFFESGTFVDTCLLVGTTAVRWQRETTGLISLHGADPSVLLDPKLTNKGKRFTIDVLFFGTLTFNLADGFLPPVIPDTNGFDGGLDDAGDEEDAN